MPYPKGIKRKGVREKAIRNIVQQTPPLPIIAELKPVSALRAVRIAYILMLEGFTLKQVIIHPINNDITITI